MKKYDTFIFDLFFTLVEPKYIKNKNEFDLLNISEEIWEATAESGKNYQNRITGIDSDPFVFIEKILLSLEIKPNRQLINQLIHARIQRLNTALNNNISSDILSTLTMLKQKNKQLILLSNADSLDVESWQTSPLKNFFDYTFFSCKTGLAKPNPEAYSHIITTLGLNKSNCLFIGDGGDNELYGAYQVGIDTCLSSQFYQRNNLEYEELVTYKINQLSELLSITK